MSTPQVEITDNAGINIAAIKNAALVGTEYGLVVRNIESPANFGFSASQIAISASAIQYSNGSPNPDRRSVRLKNGGTTTVYLGSDNSVALSGSNGGYALLPGEVEIFELGPAKNIWGIASTASGVMYVLELG
jgi:hypothetical protein